MENIADVAYTKGKEYERTYRGCSQCVVAALQDALGIRNDDIFKAATGMAGGSGMTADNGCGAYNGAILMLSYLLGRERDNFADPEGIRYKTHELVRGFRDKFLSEYGSIICRDIQTRVVGRPYYLADPDEYEKFHNAGAHDTICPEVVGKAARWMAESMMDENLLPK